MKKDFMVNSKNIAKGVKAFSFLAAVVTLTGCSTEQAGSGVQNIQQAAIVSPMAVEEATDKNARAIFGI